MPRPDMPPAQAAARGIRIGFSMTTNATLLCDEDIALFQEYGFTLTIKPGWPACNA